MVGSIQLEDFIKDNSVCASNATLYGRDDASFAQTYVAIVSSSMHKLNTCYIQLCRVLVMHW